MWKNANFSLISTTLPPVPSFGSHFITDGQRTAVMQANTQGEPIAGIIGSLQCQTREAASKLQCNLTESCSCQGQENKVSCMCTDGVLEPIFQKPDQLVPLTVGGIAITGSGTKLEAEFNHIASLQMQIQLEGLRLETKHKKNRCNITVHEFGGCYSCLTGAKMRFTCTTNFDEALALVTCGRTEFSTICSTVGKPISTILNFNRAAVKETCRVQCPGK